MGAVGLIQNGKFIIQYYQHVIFLDNCDLLKTENKLQFLTIYCILSQLL